MSKITEHSEWKRNCPDCGDTLYYSCKRYLNRAADNKSVCRSCRSLPDSMKEKLSEYWTGRKRENYAKVHPWTTGPTEWRNDCPDCGKERYFSSKFNMKNSIKKGTICNSCSTIKFKKGFWDGKCTDAQIKQMRATKAGFTGWDEYKLKYPVKKQYQLEVRRLTRQQPLQELPGYDRLQSDRGLNGVEGAYQLDHVVSIDSGWQLGIPPEYIAHISNLKVITWAENISKGKDFLVGYKGQTTMGDGIVNVPHVPLFGGFIEGDFPPTGSWLEDTEYLKQQIISAMGVPKEYLTRGDE